MKKVISFVLIFFIAILMVSNPFSNQFLEEIKGTDSSIEVSKQTNSILKEITAKADEYYIPPTDAKIDPVWKAIPGYNGLEVDIEASYKKMVKDGKFEAERLVFKQVKPSIHLDDLPPAAIYKGNPEKPVVSFIINVAWGNEYLSDMLATLRKNHVSATFFLEGRWVQKNPEMAKMIVDAGHEVGNHSYTHPDMQKLASQEVKEQIMKTNEVIKATTGSVSRWFAPPSGSYREEVVTIAAKENLGTIMWSVDTIDWQKPSPDVLINRVMSKIHNGAIILMHPTASTAQSLDVLIKEIKAKKLHIDTISELLNEERIINPASKSQDFGKNNNNDIY